MKFLIITKDSIYLENLYCTVPLFLYDYNFYFLNQREGKLNALTKSNKIGLHLFFGLKLPFVFSARSNTV